MSIVEFLSARLDEDEQVARAAQPGPWISGRERDHLRDNEVYALVEPNGSTRHVCSLVFGWEPDGCSAHIVRHNPARVIAEVTAKRALMEEHERGEDTVRLLASIYADHPDYLEEWRPKTD